MGAELEEWNNITKRHQNVHAKHLDDHDNLSEKNKSISIKLDNEFKDFLNEVDGVCQESDKLVGEFNMNTQFKVSAKTLDKAELE